MFDVLVIGGGQAGLAAGYHLEKAGLDFRILEASDETAGSWPRYYDSLKLFSPARFSSLPGRAFPGDPDRYATRDEVIAYLTDYADYFHLPILMKTRVAQVERLSEGFRVVTGNGQVHTARTLIAATGSFSRPYVPELAGRDLFKGEVLHASSYRNAVPFVGKRVVVVGAGNSAVQIAAELGKTAHVTLATRQPLNFVKQRVFGKDIHFWWNLSGFDRLPITSAERASNGGPRVLDSGIYRRAVAAGNPDRQPMFEAFTETGVRWANGQEEPVDSVILATGYRPNLDYLSNLSALDANGGALHKGGVSSVRGLYYVGLSNQRTLASASLRGVGRDAEFITHHLMQHVLRPAPTSPVCCAKLATGS